METDHTQGWNKRSVRYEDIHNVSPDDLAVLARSLALKQGDTFVDLMCGYGAVAKAALQHYKSAGISVSPILVDSSKEQLARALSETSLESCLKLNEDVRFLSLSDNSVDGIAIKMGLHEVPRRDQYDVVASAYRILRPGGVLAIWDLMFKDPTEQLAFQSIIHEKNRLAGFYDMALNRYLPREEDVRDYLWAAGFERAELVKEISYSFSSEKRLYSEFGGDKSKLEEWNDFIRAVIPENIKGKIGYKDSGRTIEAQFRKGILRAVKPISSANISNPNIRFEKITGADLGDGPDGGND